MDDDSALSELAKQQEVSLPVGIVLRRTPGVTRWATWNWQPVALLPGAPPADWHELRREGEAVEYHAATLPLTLHRSEVEAYRVSLAMREPSAFVVLRESDDGAHPLVVHAITASAYEAQDYLDSGEEQVDAVPMPQALAAFVQDFAKAHFRETPFIKRQRDRGGQGPDEDGVGDARIRQTADVYRAPAALKPRLP